MASIVLSLAALLLLTAHLARAQPVATPPAPTGPPNITAILAKGGQYNSFIRLLHQTRVDKQLNSQLNNSFNGITVFVPTDNAFSGLKAGTLNSLSQQDQIELVLYHVLSRYYSLTTFQTTSNQLITQASGKTRVWTLNVTTSNSQANVSTGVVETPINNAVYADFPLAVYSVEKVLLPYEIFGPKPPAAAPAPSTKKASPGPAADAADAAVAPPPQGRSGSGAASLKGREVGWGLAAGVGLLIVAAGNLL